jgi:3-phenylpropionate/trans-cinnamate dioxygenase ferredoxin subunit
VTGTTLPSEPGEYIWAREGEILRCPWHGWEFDITNGRSVFNPHRTRVKTYKVTVEATVEATMETTTETTLPDEDPSVETYRITVEDEFVILYI